jgi:hypothetical protein
MPAASPVRADASSARSSNQPSRPYSTHRPGESAPQRPFKRASGAVQSSATVQSPVQGPKPEPKILFQSYFKSKGPRTYAAQVKEAGNGNHFILLTEGKRDKKTDELKKMSIILFSEDFREFFKLLASVDQFVQKNPVPPEVANRQAAIWRKRSAEKRDRQQNPRA